MSNPMKSPGGKSHSVKSTAPTDEAALAISFYERLYGELLADMAHLCSISGPSLRKDLETFSRGIKSYGVDFLTKMLPALGKAFDKSLSRDLPSDVVFTELERVYPFFKLGKHSLPVFLGAFFRQVYDLSGNVGADYSITTPSTFVCRSDERLVDAVDEYQTCAVRAIRQICFLAYKLELPYDASVVVDTLASFVEVDVSLPDPNSNGPLSDKTEAALETASILMHHVLKGFRPQDIVPSHGPGSVASGERNWEKMNFSRYYRMLDEVFPYTDYFFFSYTHLCDELDVLELLTEEEGACAKVQLVPKDSRGPRIISMEPLEIQWIQQGLGRALRNHVETPSCLASGFVNFSNQEVNRDLALRNSYFGSSATLDMKDASDRVSVWLVNRLFRSRLDVLSALHACRSGDTLLPNGVRITLKKFAPMGSAVCFPLEALVFWCLAVGSSMHALRLGVTPRTYSQSWDAVQSAKIYVYGDDIVAPIEAINDIRYVFNELHLVLNEQKCCVGRFFRESCGADCFKGSFVQPVRCKSPFRSRFVSSGKSRNVACAALLSELAVCNGLQERGYDRAAEFLRGSIIERLGKPIPVVRRAGEFPCAFVRPTWSPDEVREHLLVNFKMRLNKALQRLEVRVPVPYSPSFKRGTPGWSEMLRLHPFIGSFDPFGFGGERPDACSFSVPKTVKLGGSWVSLDRLTW